MRSRLDEQSLCAGVELKTDLVWPKTLSNESFAATSFMWSITFAFVCVPGSRSKRFMVSILEFESLNIGLFAFFKTTPNSFCILDACVL